MPSGPRPARPARADWSTDAGQTLAPVPADPPAAAIPPANPPVQRAQATRRRRAYLPKIEGDTTRVTVDVPTTVHRALRNTTDEIADELPGSPHVPVGQVMAALAQLVTEDTSISDAVVAYLRDRVEQ